MTTWMLQLGSGLGAAMLLMFVLWLVQRRTHNAGIVDVGWALGIGVLVGVSALMTPGDPLRRVLVTGITLVWSLRLGIHLARRVAGEPEDGRYQNLRAWAGRHEQVVLLLFFFLQASWVVLFALPQYVAMHNAAPLGWLGVAAVGIFLVSVLGETVADRQLARFRADSANRGEVCREGLWRYSRHPNYFFEWLHWFAYPLLAIGLGPVAWLALLGPILMLVFLLKITGIPPTEWRALQSRGERYRAYQRTTSAFFPWFAKEAGP
jgi:steroid 5-alpha reductase family enzyme